MRIGFTNTAVAGTAAVAISMLAFPAAAAPAVVQYPATCASMYPDANCLNVGPGNPGRYYGYVPPSVYNYNGPGYKPSILAEYPAYPAGFAPGLTFGWRTYGRY